MFFTGIAEIAIRSPTAKQSGNNICPPSGKQGVALVCCWSLCTTAGWRPLGRRRKPYCRGSWRKMADKDTLSHNRYVSPAFRRLPSPPYNVGTTCSAAALRSISLIITHFAIMACSLHKREEFYTKAPAHILQYAEVLWHSLMERKFPFV